nr:MAG TPA: hypothetical protein [Bacteriophage sp.]
MCQGGEVLRAEAHELTGRTGGGRLHLTRSDSREVVQVQLPRQARTCNCRGSRKNFFLSRISKILVTYKGLRYTN